MVTTSLLAKIEDMAIGFIVNSNQPFDVFNDPYLREMLTLMDPAIFHSASWGRSAIRQRLATTFKAKKDILRRELEHSISKIHLAFDLWTSPNRIAILGVSAHFISDSKGVQQRLLALRQQPGAHTGNNIATSLVEVVKEWGIMDRIGVLVSDNASSNDTCTRAFYRQLYPAFSSDDILDRRLRCYGHILNLVGRAFLYGGDFESFEQESQILDSLDRDEDFLKLWRQRGPVGKLHNLVRWVRSSPQRTAYFQATVQEEMAEDPSILLSHQSTLELQLVLNNETRWNSTFLMIDRALRKQGEVQAFLSRNREELDPQRRVPLEDHLEMEDWRLLIELKDVLEPIYHQTMRTQGWAKNGSHGSLWEILTGMEFLMEKMEDWKAFFDNPANATIPQLSQTSSRSRRRRRVPSPALQALPEHARYEYLDPSLYKRLEDLSEDSQAYFRLSVTNGWKKLNEYDTKLEESPLYAAAVILHPGLGLRWLENSWAEESQRSWLRSAKEGLHDYWESWYRDGRFHTTSCDTTPRNSIPAPPRLERSVEPSQFDNWLGTRLHVSNPVESELDRYLSMSPPHPQDVPDPLEWWKSQRSILPTVSQLALDILAIPAMSADCERAFSLAKLTLTSQRHRMVAETLEEIQCLKNWLRRGAIGLGGFMYGGEAPGAERWQQATL